MMHRVCASDDVAVETAVPTTLEEGTGRVNVVVVRDSEGQVHALEDQCSHERIALSDGEVDDGTIECWKHGSAFELHTGEPTSLPATTPVRVFRAEEVDGEVFVSLTAE